MGEAGYNRESMRKLKSRIQQSYGWQRFPKFSLGFVPTLISFELAVSLFIGYFIAYFLAGPKTKQKGRVPSLTFQFRQYRIHLHHWFIFSNILLVAAITHFFVVTPLLFYGFLGGIVAQGIVHYEDWRSFVQKV